MSATMEENSIEDYFVADGWINDVGFRWAATWKLSENTCVCFFNSMELSCAIGLEFLYWNVEYVPFQSKAERKLILIRIGTKTIE